MTWHDNTLTHKKLISLHRITLGGGKHSVETCVVDNQLNGDGFRTRIKKSLVYSAANLHRQQASTQFPFQIKPAHPSIAFTPPARSHVRAAHVRQMAGSCHSYQQIPQQCISRPYNLSFRGKSSGGWENQTRGPQTLRHPEDSLALFEVPTSIVGAAGAPIPWRSVFRLFSASTPSSFGRPLFWRSSIYGSVR